MKIKCIMKMNRATTDVIYSTQIKFSFSPQKMTHTVQKKKEGKLRMLEISKQKEM